VDHADLGVNWENLRARETKVIGGNLRNRRKRNSSENDQRRNNTARIEHFHQVRRLPLKARIGEIYSPP
jgi:hypothetical protein